MKTVGGPLTKSSCDRIAWGEPDSCCYNTIKRQIFKSPTLQNQERLTVHEAGNLCGRYYWPARGHW
jgi:hypothetical protein